MRGILLSLLLFFVSHFYVSMFAETKKWSDISRDSVAFYKEQAKLSESVDNYAYYVCAQTRHMIKLGDYTGAYRLIDSLYSTKYNDIKDVKTKADVLSVMATCFDGIGCYQNAAVAEYQAFLQLKTDANNNVVTIIRALKNLCLYCENCRDTIFKPKRSAFCDICDQLCRAARDLNLNEKDKLQIELDNITAYENGEREFWLTDVLADCKEKYGKKSKQYIQALETSAFINYEYEDYYNSYSLEKEVLELSRDVFGENSLEYKQSCSKYALYLSEIGDYGSAIDYQTKVLEYYREHCGEENTLYWTSVLQLAKYYSLNMDYHEAVHLLNKFVTANNELKIYGSRIYITAMNLLADVHCRLGELQKAIDYAEESTAILKKSDGSICLYMADSEEELCGIYCEQGNYDEAIKHGKDAVNIRNKCKGKSETELEGFETLAKELDAINGSTYNKLAKCYLLKENNEEAIAFYDKCLFVHEDDKYDTPLYALALAEKANALATFKKNAEAISLYEESLELLKDICGEKSIQYANVLYNLSLVQNNEGRSNEAFEGIKRYYDIASVSLSNNLVNLTLNQRTNLWQKYSDVFTSSIPSISIKSKNTESSGLLYNNLLFSKGIMLNASIAVAKVIAESGDKEMLELYHSYISKKSALDKCYEKGIKGDVDKLKAEFETQESILLQKCNAYKELVSDFSVRWPQVKEKLSDKSIAIEFMAVPSVDGQLDYYALTLKKSYSQPHLIKLFSQIALEKLDKLQYYTNDSLSNILWGPLKNELANTSDVVFSPAGAMHCIGIEYLPVDSKQCMADKYNMYRVSSTKQLLQMDSEKHIASAVLYGGIDYEKSSAYQNVAVKNADYKDRAITDNDRLRGGVKYLEGTNIEVEEISSTLDCASVLYSGQDGTEESFKELSGKPNDVIHIATHGFYWESSKVKSFKSLQFLSLQSDEISPEDKALSRSGLLLSGANAVLRGQNLPDGIEDGVLTSREIAATDLRNTPLVVMSACQSGLGDVSSSGDVFGLQRGFKMAGVKSLIMSLWKINDEATLMLMSQFYANLQDGKNIVNAFNEARKTLREMNDGEYDSPQYWAAFVLLDPYLPTDRNSQQSESRVGPSNKKIFTRNNSKLTDSDLKKIDYLWTFYDNYINEKQPKDLLFKKNLLSRARNVYTITADYDILTRAQDDREGDIHSYMLIRHEKDNWYRITFDDGEYGKAEILIEVIEQDGYKISDIRVIE